jgi:hypothetical protein
MQRKQKAAVKKRLESWENLGPRVLPGRVQRVELEGDYPGMGIICSPGDWRRVRTVKTEARRQGS